ncbi:family 16 glycosylhydrolase [Streptomyces sp. YC504]|uniref:licheninase n=1 Tax=Streptomyces mesophilus TaxID=1775132 RepID=A0A6G4XIJ9_9ACTN|nr:family 16 glycosylhydrolase [Streptomyces mesophilus]NGO76534.1 family 16 glycosylhydrolase [Streptomyces mesophilus]
MRRRPGLAGIAAALVLTAGALGAAPDEAVAAPPTASYELIWADEFNTTAVDASEWNYRTDTKGWSQQRPENVTVGGGAMTVHLCPRNKAGAGCTQQVDSKDLYTGGGLISKRKTRYGYYETRVRTNSGSGWHSAFWAAEAGSGTEPRTEIDGFEIDSHVPDKVRHNVIAWTQGTFTSNIYGLDFDSSADWHTYGFEWLEDSVKFYVDGVLKWSQPYAPSAYTHNFLNTWLTAIAYDASNSPGVDESALPGKVQFDYVRHYARDVYADNDAPSGYSETGTGWSTSGLPAFGRLTGRFSCDTDSAGRWTFTPPADGTYQGYFFRAGGEGGQADAPVSVWDGGTALSRTRVDLTAPGSSWAPLGAHTLKAGTTYIVRIDRDGPGCIRADAVKFVRS